jgi:hypothetical protein
MSLRLKEDSTKARVKVEIMFYLLFKGRKVLDTTGSIGLVG